MKIDAKLLVMTAISALLMALSYVMIHAQGQNFALGFFFLGLAGVVIATQVSPAISVKNPLMNRFIKGFIWFATSVAFACMGGVIVLGIIDSIK